MEDTVKGVQLERLERAAEQLAEKGYAVVPGVLSAQECQRIYADLWTAVESVTSKQDVPVDRNVAATHRGEAFPRQIKGIIEEPPALSHCGAAWEVRKAAAPYFARLHGTPKLAVSFDRINMMPVPVRNVEPRNWMHTHNTPLLNGLHSIQGFVDLLGTGPNDGGLVVAEGSHLEHHELLYKEWGVKEAANWYKFSDTERAIIDERFTIVHVVCPAGSLVLWDSRTFHQNKPPTMNGHARAVIYVSYQPLECVPPKKLDKILQRRIEAFKEMRSASHIALSHFKLFGKSAQTYGGPPRVYHLDAAELGIPSLKNDPVVASLVGKSHAPAVKWTKSFKPLLIEPMLDANLMVANKTQLLKAQHTGRTKRKRHVTDDDDDDDTPAKKIARSVSE
jgi:hypothetical protein